MREIEFDHDRLDAYRLAREAARSLAAVMREIPRGNAELRDQARRAGPSVCLNTAEGTGAWLPGEKARFYRTARASGTECAAILDHMVDCSLVSEKSIEPTRRLYARVVSTLIKLTLVAESTLPPPPPEPLQRSRIRAPRATAPR